MNCVVVCVPEIVIVVSANQVSTDTTQSCTCGNTLSTSSKKEQSDSKKEQSDSKATNSSKLHTVVFRAQQ